jgi:hypothetical protein
MTTSTKVVCGATLTQIQRVSDGVFGGWIEKESNLSQDGTCFVYGDAVVYDNARVCDNAQVYGNAWVYGNAVVSICLFVQQLKYNITVVDTHIFIGCQGHTWKYWKENIQAIGKEAGYSELEIKDVDKLLRVLTRQVRAEILKTTKLES